MEQIINFFKNIYQVVVDFFNNVIVNYYTNVLTPFYKNNVVTKLPFLSAVKLWWLLLGIAVLILIIFILIIVSCCKKKKRKVKFYVDEEVYKTVKAKYKKPIDFPVAPSKDGYQFTGWYLDSDLKVLYEETVLDRKKNLSLYAGYEKVQEVEDKTVCDNTPCENETSAVVSQPNDKPVSSERSVGYEILDFSVEDEELKSQFIYDELRYAMLGYERAMQFKKLGIVRKQNIAEMFEKDGVVYLYLKVNPKIMREKGFNVEENQDSRFSPCKVAVKTKQDLSQALLLIKEAMTVNNLVKSGITFAQKPASTEEVRKSGFAFFVKNETVATTVDDYYRLLRAIVLSYEKAENANQLESDVGKMILKIFKKGETINVYLALNAFDEGLKDVSYDRNFADTPSLIEVKTAEDCVVANEFIDKLMYRYKMVRNPEKAEVSMEDPIQKNCGFGYRIKN